MSSRVTGRERKWRAIMEARMGRKASCPIGAHGGELRANARHGGGAASTTKRPGVRPGLFGEIENRSDDFARRPTLAIILGVDERVGLGQVGLHRHWIPGE